MVRLLNLGVESYAKALDLQHRLVEARKKGASEDVLILLEHPPVVTLGRRADESNLLVSQEWLARQGIGLYRVERGGDVTYHGPGQLVGYPILDLRGYRQDVGWYVRSLEEVLLRALADFGLRGELKEGLVGVWVGDEKIAAIGARIEEWITYHGFALNVNTNLEHFNLIVPCGITGKGVTSMQKLLGRTVDMEAVRGAVVRQFGEVFGVQVSGVARQSTKVEAVFGADGRIHPTSFTWQGRTLHVSDAGRQWTEGEERHVLVMVGGRQAYELVLNTRTMAWHVIKLGVPVLAV